MFSLQELVDDIAEVLHLRASRDGEWDIIYNIPTKQTLCYTHQTHTYIYI